MVSSSVGLSSFLTAIMLLAFGVVLLVWFCWILFVPLMHLLRGKKGRTQVRKGSSRIEKADALIADQKFMEALKQLRRAIVFDRANSVKMVEYLKDHHQNVLSRCLIIAEELNSRAENIAEVERLFMQRSELQLHYLKSAESYKSLKSRRAKAGKEIPTWTKTDFQKRVTDIRKDLQENSDALQRALDKLFTSLSTPSVDHIVYH